MIFLNDEALQILHDLERLDVVFGETHVRDRLYSAFDVITGTEDIEVKLDAFHVNALLVCLELCSSMFGYSGFRQELIFCLEDELLELAAQS